MSLSNICSERVVPEGQLLVGIPEMIGGEIPGSVFHPSVGMLQETSIETSYGTLVCEMGSVDDYGSSFELFYPGSQNPHNTTQFIRFGARIRRQQDDRYVLELFVRNRLDGIDEDQHPRLPVADLFRATVAYFDNFYKYDTIRARWFPYTTNYDQYRAGRQQGLSPQAAALERTWTGQQAGLNAFDKAIEVHENYYDSVECRTGIQVLFHRNSEEN